MTLKNISANYIAAGLVGLINIFSLSIYVKWLGMARWGEVAAYLAIVNGLMVLELGISQVYISQYHKKSAPSDLFLKYRSALLSLALAGSLLTGIVLMVLTWMIADIPVIYQRWDLMLMALLLFILNIINNLYYANLMAVGRQVEQNLRWVCFVFLKNALALVLMIVISNLPEIYFIAFIIVAGLELWINRKTAHESLTEFCKWVDIVSVVKQSGFISLGIGLGIFVFNIDRLVMPSLMSSDAFGVYSAVVTVGLYFLQLQYPVTRALFPVLARKINIDPEAAGPAMWKQALMLGGMVAPLLLIAALCADRILEFYSVPKAYLENARWLFHGVLLSVLINAVYHGIYMRLVVENRGRLIVVINFFTLVVALSILVWLGATAPFVAGALAWCSISSVQLLGSAGCYGWWRHAVR
jgi:O-antigen/teichoic acid export membrane protein